MFRIKFLPARYGDAIRIAYGDPKRPCLVLIDGGTGGTRADILADLATFPNPRLELLVVTHIDRDHIEGALRVLEEEKLNVPIGEIWFNGWRHLPPEQEGIAMGAKHGERFSQQIELHKIPWNRFYDGEAITRSDRVFQLPGGMKLTVLNPTFAALQDLRDDWEEEILKAGLVPGYGAAAAPDEQDDDDEAFAAQSLPDIEALADTKYHDDDSAANNSSIALIVEYEGRCVLLPGDVPATPLLEALEQKFPGEKVKLDLVKLSHHGSRHTTSKELIRKLDCRHYVVSTNGSSYGHPDDEALARVIKFAGPKLELSFNYRSARNKHWDLDVLKDKHGYVAIYPILGEEGIEIS